MFLDYYNLREQPFGVTPDPRYLYLSPTHREALASLFYGIDSARGFLSLIAKPGMGKTTLLNTLQERLQGKARLLFVSQTQCNSSELLRWLLRKLHVDSDSQDLPEMQDKMTQFLAREALAGRRFVLVIDEAQNLDDSVLETVRLLSNCETPTAKLLQILLAGQPQLATKVTRPGLEQLRQRIGISSRVDPLSAEETERYISHRLHVAGLSGGNLFSSNALESIADLSHGIPRNINNLGFGALSLGYATGRKKIDANLVKEAAADLDMRPSPNSPSAVSTRVTLPAVARSAMTLSSFRVGIPPIGLVRRQVIGFGLAAGLLIAGAFTISARVRTRPAAAADDVSSARPDLVNPNAPPGPSEILESSNTPESASEGVEPIFASVDSSSVQAIPQSTALEPPVQTPAAETVPAAGTDGNSPVADGRTMSILVERGDTLRKICRKYAGGDDLKTLERLLTLNPSIKNLDHVEVGQRIRVL